MAYRPLEIELISAKDLRNVNIFLKMDVYVVASISSDPRSVERTQTDKHGGMNPKWKYKMQFMIDEGAAIHNQTALVFQIVSRRVFGDRTIGSVYVPLKDLLHEYNISSDHHYSSSSGGSDGHTLLPKRSVCYQVTTVSGKSRGTLSFSYRFGEGFMVSVQPQGHHLIPALPQYPATTQVEGGPYHSQGYTYPVPVGYPYLTAAGHHVYGPPPGTVEQTMMNRRPEKKSQYGGSGIGEPAGFLGSLLTGGRQRNRDDRCTCCGFW